MTETLKIRVQHKRMTQAEWLQSHDILLEGEIGVETDTGYLKVGNGTDVYRELAYLTGPKGDKGDTGAIDRAQVEAINTSIARKADTEQVDGLQRDLVALKNSIGKVPRVYGDWNDVTETGDYAGNNLKNAPATNQWSMVSVRKFNDDWIWQLGSAFGGGIIASRWKRNGVWSSWESLI